MDAKLPPQNLEAEQSVLGSMMISKDATILAAGALAPKDFYRDAHSNIYNAMVTILQKSEPIDVVTVAAELKRQGTLETSGGNTYLAELVNAIPSAANAEHHIAIVHEKSLLRNLINTANSIASDAFEDTDEVDIILTEAQKSIMDITISKNQNPLIKLGEIITDAWDKISETYESDDKILGIPTGFSELDQLTSGFQKSDLIIIGARPAMGKTSLALNFAVNAATKHQKSVGIFSMEMSKEQLALRMLSTESRVNLARLRTANIAEGEYKDLVQALGRLSEAPIFIDDTPAISPLSIRAKCHQLALGSKLDLIIIDYLQMMRIGKKTCREPVPRGIRNCSRTQKHISRA